MKNTFELEHVGINTDNAGEAEQLALLRASCSTWSPATDRSPSLPATISSA